MVLPRGYVWIPPHIIYVHERLGTNIILLCRSQWRPQQTLSTDMGQKTRCKVINFFSLVLPRFLDWNAMNERLGSAERFSMTNPGDKIYQKKALRIAHEKEGLWKLTWENSIQLGFVLMVCEKET